MDSLKGSHSGLKDIIQSYLWEEWKERHPEAAADNLNKFLNLDLSLLRRVCQKLVLLFASQTRMRKNKTLVDMISCGPEDGEVLKGPSGGVLYMEHAESVSHIG